MLATRELAGGILLVDIVISKSCAVADQVKKQTGRDVSCDLLRQLFVAVVARDEINSPGSTIVPMFGVNIIQMVNRALGYVSGCRQSWRWASCEVKM